MHTCGTPSLGTEAMQVTKMKAIFSIVLDDMYASNPDNGLKIVYDPRASSAFVECTTPCKSIMLIPWSHVFDVDMSKTSVNCECVQSFMGTVDGQHVKITPKQNIFDRKTTNMAASPSVARHVV